MTRRRSQATSPATATLLGTDDVTVDSVAGTHFGGPIGRGEPTGTELAADVMQRWLDLRFSPR